jgi:hypothetical protein
LRGFARLKAAHELPPAAAGGNFVFSADRPTPKMLILRQKVARDSMFDRDICERLTMKDRECVYELRAPERLASEP